MPYTNDDQDFFFRITNEILNHFGILVNLQQHEMFDYIMEYSDLLVNRYINLITALPLPVTTFTPTSSPNNSRPETPETPHLQQ